MQNQGPAIATHGSGIFIIIMMNDIIANPRSHYRYNWQWDYVQKYAEAHHKNLLQVFVLD